MRVLKIISIFVIAFYLATMLIASFKDENKGYRIFFFALFLLTLIPFYVLTVI